MKKLLVATDGSEHSKTALAFATEMAKLTGASLTIGLVNVVRGGGRAPYLYAFEDKDAERIVKDAAAQALKAGVSKVDEVLLKGREASAAIVHYAESAGVDHIIVGTGDKHGISRLMLGSVAADVASRAHCGVTIAR
ncbi:MAG: universal stress protein [Hyphomicrobiales bacterium]